MHLHGTINHGGDQVAVVFDKTATADRSNTNPLMWWAIKHEGAHVGGAGSEIDDFAGSNAVDACAAFPRRNDDDPTRPPSLPPSPGIPGSNPAGHPVVGSDVACHYQRREIEDTCYASVTLFGSPGTGYLAYVASLDLTMYVEFDDNGEFVFEQFCTTVNVWEEICEN